MKVTIPIEENKESSKKNALLKDSEYTKYFKSKEHELAFYFKVNNANFDKILGIKRIHMTDVNKAKELRRLYLSIFNFDQNAHTETDLNYSEICADISATFHRVSSGKL